MGGDSGVFLVFVFFWMVGIGVCGGVVGCFFGVGLGFLGSEKFKNDDGLDVVSVLIVFRCKDNWGGELGIFFGGDVGGVVIVVVDVFDGLGLCFGDV